MSSTRVPITVFLNLAEGLLKFSSPNNLASAGYCWNAFHNLAKLSTADLCSSPLYNRLSEIRLDTVTIASVVNLDKDSVSIEADVVC